MILPNTIHCGDCLKIMPHIEDNSIDMVLCDLPYGYIASEWDAIIPIDKLWEQYKRILKPNGVVALFGNEPFASTLRLSNTEWYRYDWYWEKPSFANFAQAPYMPLKNIETISIFSKGNIAPNSKLKMNYFPQGLQKCLVEITNRPCSKSYRPNRKPQSYTQTKTGYPRQLLSFEKDPDSWHPTQKPVNLLRYLILTYTQSGDVILDNCMGSGSTIVAAIKEKRQFIGIEKDEVYFAKAKAKIEQEQSQLTLF